MENPICLSTSCFYRLTDDRNEMIERIRKFSPDGIELSFAYPESLSEFTITEENLEYLQSLEFRSIHAPWKEIMYVGNRGDKGTLELVEQLYKQIGGRSVVFHEQNLMVFSGWKRDKSINIFESHADLLKNYDFIPSIENSDWRKHGVADTVEGIETILSENDNLKFTFDFAHALTVSPESIPEFLDRFRDKLTEIHLSFSRRGPEGHYFLHKHDSEETRELLSHLKSTDVPLVFECFAREQDEVPLIKEEMDYIRRI